MPLVQPPPQEHPLGCRCAGRRRSEGRGPPADDLGWLSPQRGRAVLLYYPLMDGGTKSAAAVSQAGKVRRLTAQRPEPPAMQPSGGPSRAGFPDRAKSFPDEPI